MSKEEKYLKVESQGKITEGLKCPWNRAKIYQHYSDFQKPEIAMIFVF